ncbi:MAG TPA: aminotransferase class V-fold PLP-dependent enzyme [Pirellulales bacterium]|nr:aminotransferase class V-fold PLP-dependent enzyme [Pirellulales bacterium]
MRYIVYGGAAMHWHTPIQNPKSKIQNPVLAIDGGPAALPCGPPAWPLADPDVLAALERAFADGSWGRYLGPNVERLATALAEYHAVEYVTLCCSGTFAVELALRGLQIGAGDEVLMAGYDFPGNFRAIESVGALPVLVDVDPLNWNLDPGRLPAARGERTRAVLVSHLHGGLVPMVEVVEFARQYGLVVVEDACQAPGATVEGRLAGTAGDVGVLSFGGSKLLTAGRGGAILTRRADIHQRAKIHCEKGNNAFPLSELQAAVLLPQLAKLDGRNAARRFAADRLARGLAGVPGVRTLSNRAGDFSPSFYKLGMQFSSNEMAGRSRAEFVAGAQAEGVALDAGFRGFALRTSRRCRAADDLAESRRAAAGMVVLHHPVLLEDGAVIDQVASAIEKVVRVFSLTPNA